MTGGQVWAFAVGVAAMALLAQLTHDPWTVPAVGATAALVSIGLQVRAWWSRRA